MRVQIKIPSNCTINLPFSLFASTLSFGEQIWKCEQWKCNVYGLACLPFITFTMQIAESLKLQERRWDKFLKISLVTWKDGRRRNQRNKSILWSIGLLQVKRILNHLHRRVKGSVIFVGRRNALSGISWAYTMSGACGPHVSIKTSLRGGPRQWVSELVQSSVQKGPRALCAAVNRHWSQNQALIKEPINGC